MFNLLYIGLNWRKLIKMPHQAWAWVLVTMDWGWPSETMKRLTRIATSTSGSTCQNRSGRRGGSTTTTTAAARASTDSSPPCRTFGQVRTKSGTSWKEKFMKFKKAFSKISKEIGYQFTLRTLHPVVMKNLHNFPFHNNSCSKIMMRWFVKHKKNEKQLMQHFSLSGWKWFGGKERQSK